MEYRGVQYAIRIGINRGLWQLAVYLPDRKSPQRDQLSESGKTRKLQLTRSLMLGSKSVSASTWPTPLPAAWVSRKRCAGFYRNSPNCAANVLPYAQRKNVSRSKQNP